MTYEEVLQYAKGGLEVYQRDYPELITQIEFQKLVIEALEKQVPKKPIVFVSDRYDYPEEAYRCSICNSDNGEYLYKGQRYCDECGNAVDWIL